MNVIWKIDRKCRKLIRKPRTIEKKPKAKDNEESEKS